MSARERIASLLWWSVPSSDDAEAEARTEQMLDAYRAEERAERDAEIIAWLYKKAREYPSAPERQESLPAAVERLADKISRGGVRGSGGVLAERDEKIRVGVLREAADVADETGARLTEAATPEAATGAYDVMTKLRRMADSDTKTEETTP